MFYFKVILISLASLSTVQAIDECGVPKRYFSIDKYGRTNCGSNCSATVVFSGYREYNAEYVTVDMIADHYESKDSMKLQFWYDNILYNLTCPSRSIFRKENANGLQCYWELRLTGNANTPITNGSIWRDFLLDGKLKTNIYFGFNDHKALVASNLSSLIPYNEIFPDCTEYDVLTFYDPKRLNKITLSKKKDSITGFIIPLKNDTKSVDRTLEFSNADDIKFAVTCTDSFHSQSRYLVRYGWNDWSTDLSWPKFTLISGARCSFTVPLKIHSMEYKYDFDFNKKPINMAFDTTQPKASFYKSNIKFKYD